jgi:hypothetical protein
MNANLKAKSGTGSREDLPYVTGQMKFANAVGSMESTPYECKVYDARPIADELSLDREGFKLINHESTLAKQGDVNVLRRESDAYLADLAPAIKEAIGASWVIPRTASNTGVVVRSATKIVPGDPFYYVRNKGGIEIPFPGVHIDYTPESALNLAKAEHHHRGIPERAYKRMIIIQAWQAVSPPPQDRPLAILDASTLNLYDTFAMGNPPDPNDLSGDYIQARFVVFKPNQRWYYFSNMVHSEVILFKGYDSANLLTCAHASFLNTSLGSSGHPRESVEGRFFCYFN